VNGDILTYLRHLPAITASLDAVGVPFFFNNPLFILSRLAKSPGFRIVELDGGLLFDAAGRWASILPTTTRRTRYRALVHAAIVPRRKLMRLPEWLLPTLWEYDASAWWPDCLGDSAALQTLAGRKYKSIRQGILRAERSGRVEVVRLGPAHAQEAAQITRDWCATRAAALGTICMEEENLWLFENLGWLDEHLPGFWGIGVTVDGQLQAVNLSCVLSRSVWCSHTERYRPGILAYCNQLAFREACRVVDPAQLPWVNDGSAEAPVVPGVNNLASFKARLTHHTLVPYTV